MSDCVWSDRSKCPVHGLDPLPRPAAAVPEAEDGRDAPTDAEIDADLRAEGFDDSDTWAEYSHESLRTAWRAGYATAPAVPARDDERERLAAAAALHTGLHQCIGGQWYSDSEPSYRGTVAAHTACPTAALIRAALAAPLPEGQEGT